MYLVKKNQGTKESVSIFLLFKKREEKLYSYLHFMKTLWKQESGFMGVKVGTGQIRHGWEAPSCILSIF